MPTSGDGSVALPHVVLLPSAGMGHLVPFSRLAVALTSGHGCDVSLATVLPTVSSAESAHLEALFAACPAVRRLDFHLAQFDASEFPGADPFFLRFEAMRRSAPLLGPLLAGAHALVTDIALASVVIPVAKELRLPCYVLFTASAAMLSLCVHFPAYLDASAGGPVGDVDVPGVYRVPKASIPQALHDPKHLFTRQFVANGRELARSDGLLVNSFDALEPEAIAALQNGSVVAGFPPVFSVGPLAPVSFSAGEPAKSQSDYMRWLEAQPARSVVYVSFGSRKAISKDQLRELAAGLEASGHRFLWVVKSTVVDREDTAELRDVLGDGFLGRVQGRGLVTKEWVDQEAVLKHPAIGLYLTHCGWNSMNESVMYGVPMLAWPSVGDHRMIATVIRSGGFGLWVEHWRWDGMVVSGAEIAEKVKLAMADEAISAKAAEFREEATKAVAVGGSSHRNLHEFLAKLNTDAARSFST